MSTPFIRAFALWAREHRGESGGLPLVYGVDPEEARGLVRDLAAQGYAEVSAELAAKGRVELYEVTIQVVYPTFAPGPHPHVIRRRRSRGAYYRAEW